MSHFLFLTTRISHDGVFPLTREDEAAGANGEDGVVDDAVAGMTVTFGDGTIFKQTHTHT